MPKTKSSDRRVAANRANAQKSTGPNTPDGKAKSALNAIKTGLTGRTVLLPTEDAREYQLHLKRFFYELAPGNTQERHLTQSIADLQWRLDRIASLESGLLAIAEEECADMYPDKAPDVRKTMIEASAYNQQAPALKNLHLQETRLRRQLLLDRRELERLKHERYWDEQKAALARKQRGEAAIEKQHQEQCLCGQCDSLNAQDGLLKRLTPPVASNLQTPETGENKE